VIDDRHTAPVCTTTPGSDAAAHEMWLRLSLLAQQQLVRTVGFQSSPQIQSYLNDVKTLPDSLQRMDVNRDGNLTIDEIFNATSAANPSLTTFLEPGRL